MSTKIGFPDARPPEQGATPLLYSGSRSGPDEDVTGVKAIMAF